MVVAEIVQAGVGWQPVGDEGRRAAAESEDLAAVTDRQEAGDPVDRRAEVIGVAAHGDAGVDRHADAEVGADRPASAVAPRCPAIAARAAADGSSNTAWTGVADRLEHGPAGELDRVA